MKSTLLETLLAAMMTHCGPHSCSLIDICFSFDRSHVFFSKMGESGEHKDSFKLSRDWLSVQEVVDAVSSPSCGAISVFIGRYLFTTVETIH